MAKIGISLGIAVEAAVTLQHDPLPSTNTQILAQVLVQAAIGFVLGFVISLFVTAIVAAGSLIDLFSGSEPAAGARPPLAAADADHRPVLQPGGHGTALHHGLRSS